MLDIYSYNVYMVNSSYSDFIKISGSTSNKLQQKQALLILFPYDVFNDRKKVLRIPCGGTV